MHSHLYCTGPYAVQLGANGKLGDSGLTVAPDPKNMVDERYRGPQNYSQSAGAHTYAA